MEFGKVSAWNFIVAIDNSGHIKANNQKTMETK